MLAIRMQRTGRKGYATFRVIVQDSKFSPTSGRVVAKIGHHNPHTKDTSIDTELVKKYLSQGAQPTPRVVRLLMAEKVELPDWVEMPDNSKKSKIKNAEKLRKNQPKEEPAPEAEAPVEEAPAEEAKPEEATEEKPAEEPAQPEEKPTEKTEDTPEEAPAEDK